jgi:uncharacterized protein (DUF488 family)
MFYQVGYTGVSVHAFTQTVKRLNAVVIDVRLSPFGRPDFSKHSLTQLLGSRYVHVPDFGNLNYRGPGPTKLKNFERGFQTIENLVRSGRTLIFMCACRDYSQCHRKDVCEAITRRTGIVSVPLTVQSEPVKNRLEKPAKGGQADFFLDEGE